MSQSSQIKEQPSASTPRKSSSANSAVSQNALFQAYINAIRSGQIPMPNVAQPSAAVAATQKAQQQANHNRTISDVKKGVTFAGQDTLKHLPIPSLEETCHRYLESAKPFLVYSD
jgi:hypothetical protein